MSDLLDNTKGCRQGCGLFILVWALMIALVLMFTSCQKEEETFSPVGKYDGVWSYETPHFSKEESYAYRCITEGYNEGEIYISTNWGNGVQCANLYVNSYSYDAFEIAGTSNCGMSVVTISGTGKFVGDSLFESGKLIFTTENGQYEGVWKAKFKKRN